MALTTKGERMSRANPVDDAVAAALAEQFVVVISDVDVDDAAAFLRAAGIDPSGSVVGASSSFSPYLTVGENLFLGHEPRRFGMVDRSRLERETEAMLAELGIPLAARAPLRSVERALLPALSIAQTILRGHDVVVAADRMPPPAPSFLRAVELAGRRGARVVVVGSRTAPYLRAGSPAVIVGADESAVRVLGVVEAPVTVARVLDVFVPETAGSAGSLGSAGREDDAPLVLPDEREPVLEVTGWTVTSPLDETAFVARDVDLVVRPGEIVGVTGEGAADLVLSLFAGSMGAPESGSVLVRRPGRGGAGGTGGVEVGSASVEQAFAAGFAYGTEHPITYDVQLLGGIPTSVSPAALRKLRERGIIDASREYTVRTGGPLSHLAAAPDSRLFTEALRQLAAGNSSVVALHEPFAADRSARLEIMPEFRGQGVGVVLASGDPRVLAQVCDRVVVVAEAEVHGVVRRGIADAGSQGFLRRIVEERFAARFYRRGY